MLKYRLFSSALSYPEEDPKLALEYDRLFRAREVWLYGAEYLAQNEFDRVKILSDISGFYRAFGIETNADRVDHLPAELEFMYYLIFKEQAAKNREQKAVCAEAQKNFFGSHLYPAAAALSKKVRGKTENGFYRQVIATLFKFMQKEKKILKCEK
jgi:TorA maturation chaperone TorD